MSDMIEKNILFDKFEIIHCLKKDTHTSVYLAKHVHLGKNIIVKILDTQQVSDPAILNRFKREAKILARLDHPHIIKVLDFGIEKNLLFLSCEYFENKSLREIIKQNKLTLAEKKLIVIQLARGLAYAHNNNIIHRDLKPENILVNQQLDVKIADFGLSLFSDENSMTQKAAIVGTPGYMSPEQIRGEKLTPQSDLFSLGIIAFELVSGYHPFIGKNINETLNNILQFDEQQILQEVEALPQDFHHVICHLLNKNPNERGDSASEIVKDLGSAFDSAVPGHKKHASLIARRHLFIPISFLMISMVFILFLLFNKQEQTKPYSVVNEKFLTVDSSLINDDNHHVIQDTNLKNQVNVKKSAPINYDLRITQMQASKENTITSQIPGKLIVQCLPWADVYIDSIKVDTTPMDEAIRIFPGDYVLKLMHPSYPPYLKPIHIDPGEQLTFKVSLDTLFGYLACQVYPWGEVYIDKIHYGHTPLLAPIILTPGKHQLTIKHPEYDSVNEYISIDQEDTTHYKLNLEKIIGFQNGHTGTKHN